MPNRTVHAMGAAIGVGVIHIAHERSKVEKATGFPLVSAGLAGCLGSIPDMLEPATNPNHRQFCHSVLAGVFVIWSLKKIYDWQPATPAQEFLRYLSLIAGGAYTIHLVQDALTKKSLPLIGRI
jgi:inner membrane protein